MSNTHKSKGTNLLELVILMTYIAGKGRWLMQWYLARGEECLRTVCSKSIYKIEVGRECVNRDGSIEGVLHENLSQTV